MARRAAGQSSRPYTRERLWPPSAPGVGLWYGRRSVPSSVYTFLNPAGRVRSESVSSPRGRPPAGTRPFTGGASGSRDRRCRRLAFEQLYRVGVEEHEPLCLLPIQAVLNQRMTDCFRGLG